MIFYLASNWGSQRRIRDVRSKLVALGHTVRSGWLDETSAQSFESLDPARRREYSYRDMGEIATVDVVCVDTQEPSPSGGREVECGMALAHGKPLFVVGPSRNIFHEVAHRQYADWSEVFAVLLRAYHLTEEL